MIISRSIHDAANSIISFLMAEYYYFIYLYVFFIHSSVDKHLGCFHVLAFVNSAAMNIGVHVSFQIMFFSGYMPRSGIIRSYGSSIFHFLENSILFSIVAVSIYISTNSVGSWFPFLHTLSSIYCLWIFYSISIFKEGYHSKSK